MVFSVRGSNYLLDFHGELAEWIIADASKASGRGERPLSSNLRLAAISRITQAVKGPVC